MRKGFVFNFLLSMSILVVIIGTQTWMFAGVSVYDMSIAISYVLIFFSIFFFDQFDRTCWIFLFWLCYFPILKLTKELASVGTKFYEWECYVLVGIYGCLTINLYWKEVKNFICKRRHKLWGK